MELVVCRYQQIMHYHMQNEEYGKVIEACKRYGEQESCLWEQALGYFARKEEDCKTYISEVLQHIDQNNLMPPLLGEFKGIQYRYYWEKLEYHVKVVLFWQFNMNEDERNTLY